MSRLFVIGKPAFLILIIAALNQSCGLFGGRGGDKGELWECQEESGPAW
jgi:hypothetical protein